MTAYLFLLYLHVLLFVFWIGTDVGVFVLGKIAQKPHHSAQRRADSFEIALVLDRMPRMCFALMFPVGASLAAILGLLALSNTMLAVIWAVGLFWLLLVIGGFSLRLGPLFTACRTADRIVQILLLIVLLMLAVPSLIGDGPITAPWFAWKLLAFAVLTAAALTLDFLSSPMPAIFAQLARDGASPALDADIDRRMRVIFVFVGIIYASALVAAFSGVTKLPY